MDRDAIIGGQRDALWVLALRTKLLRAQSNQQLAAARRLANDARETVARVQMLERRNRARGSAAGHRTVVALVRRADSGRA